MAQEYYTLITASGGAAIAAAIVAGQPLTLSHLAVGEGQAAPNEAATALQAERWRGAASVAQDAENPNWLVVQADLPEDAGGFTVREVGVYAGATLVAIGNYPATYVPLLTSGARKAVSLRAVIEVATPGAVG